MATIADLLGAKKSVEIDGKVYEIGEPTLLQQSKFQRWLEQRARESVDRATYLDDDGRERAQNALTRDIAAGVYEWGGAVAVAAVQSQSGAAKLLEILLDVDPETAAAAVKTHLERIAQLVVAAEQDDPKALSAALTSLGLPSDFLSSDSSTRRSAGRSKKSRR